MSIPVTVINERRTTTTADAFWLPDSESHQFAHLLAKLCRSNIGNAAATVPSLYRLANAWLLVPASPSPFTAPGLIRLRRVAEHYYIPLDGRLSVGLLPDEFTGLRQGHGVVQLASGCQAYQPNEPVAVSSWLRFSSPRLGSWTPFPTLPVNPNDLRKIEQLEPPSAIIMIFEQGEPEGHNPLPTSGERSVSESDRPPAASIIMAMGAGAALGMAAAMAWLGRNLGLGQLAQMGAALAKQAIEQAPRLSEKVVGAQEAALRELLRQLQSGDTEKALKRAPIAVADPNAKASIANDSRLHEHDTRYSYGGLFRNGGVASAWVGGGDVWLDLQREYRRLADEAVKRGDYRRAAYLLGVLLRDLRGAAQVLKTGGLYRDAALLFRDRLNEPILAADTFDLAGDFDEAVRLYIRHVETLKAAELLRRIGDEQRAIECFLSAADQLILGAQYLEAGDLIRAKVGDEALATSYYQSGWDACGADAVRCGERLVDVALATNNFDQLNQLVNTSMVRFAPPSQREASQFLNHVLNATLRSNMSAEVLDDLQDRVRLHFAEHIQTAPKLRAQNDIDALLNNRTYRWSAAMQRDALFAATNHVVRKARPVAPRLGVDGKVAAVAYARDTGIVFIGTHETVSAFKLQSNAITKIITLNQIELRGLCTDHTGETLYTLEDGLELWLTAWSTHLKSGRRAEKMATREIEYKTLDDLYMQPQSFIDPDANFIVVGCDGTRTCYHAQMLTTGSSKIFKDSGDQAVWCAQVGGNIWDWSGDALFAWRRVAAVNVLEKWAYYKTIVVNWTPTAGVGNQKKLDWRSIDPTTMALAGIDTYGMLHHEIISLDSGLSNDEHVTAMHPRGYAAVVLIDAKTVAAVTNGNDVHFLRASGTKLATLGKPIPLLEQSRVVFLCHYAPSHELILIFEDGSIKRLPDER